MKNLLTLFSVCLVATTTTTFANDIVPINDNEIYVCAREAGEEFDGVCGNREALKDVAATVTFYSSKDGRITSGSVIEAFHTIEGQLIRNSIGSQVYEFKGSKT